MLTAEKIADLAPADRLVLECSVANASLLAYSRRSMPSYLVGEHHRVIAQHLEAVERGEIKRLMIFAPPRHGKTELLLRFQAWFLGRNPERRVIACSHTDRLAWRNSRRVRAQMQAPSWPFDVSVAPGAAAVTAWDIAGHRGGYWAAGVGGAITGEGADLLVIDDPIKSRQHADSPVLREGTWEWYHDDAYTRLEPGAAIVLMHTRWHEDDLAGRLLQAQHAGGDQWTVLTFRALDEHENALWPERYDADALRGIRDAVTPRTWWALYQQDPKVAGGNLFQREWMDARYDPRSLPALDAVVLTVDSAWKVGVGNDWSVIAVWGATDTHYLLLDLWRARVEMPDLVTAIGDVYAKWQRLSPTIYVEDKASGTGAVQVLQRTTRLPVVPWSPGVPSKVQRAEAITPLFRAGRVQLPETAHTEAPWLADWIDEHLAFPAGHDDQVDTTSMALSLLQGSGDPWMVYED
jgi:predicted phage terminase large subunit-like protein